MKYTYTTTEEMDIALAAEAKNQNTTAEALFNTIVTADMGTLTRNYEVKKKDEVYSAYKTSPSSAALIDAEILAAKPIKDTNPITEPIVEVIK